MNNNLKKIIYILELRKKAKLIKEKLSDNLDNDSKLHI